MKKLLVLFALIAAPLFAQDDPTSRSWNQPIEPFRIAGNIYYVGANEITSFLIATPKGHIVIDGGFKETAPMILANIEKLGFKASDVRILLSSHAHFDHAGGLLQLKRATGATFYASRPEVAALARGGVDDPQFGDKYPFPPIEADRIVDDGQRVTLDGTTLVAHITAGHTRGCTTWTMNVREGGKQHGVVFFCSPTAPGYKLVGNPRYPEVVDDYRRQFATLKKLDCDIALASHGNFFSLTEKRNRLVTEKTANPFIDHTGCRNFILLMEQRFEDAVREQTP